MIPKDPIEQSMLNQFVKKVLLIESEILSVYLWCTERWSMRVCIEHVARTVFGLKV